MNEVKKNLELIVISLVLAVLMGTVSFIFLKTLEVVGTFRDKHFSKKGNNLIIESVQKEVSVPVRMAAFTFCFTVLTHLCGGSAGREGTSVYSV